MAESRAVTKTNGGAVAPYNFDDDETGAGSENVNKDWLVISMIYILQANSPQVDSDDSEHIKGAKAGFIFNRGTRDIFNGKEGITFTPVYADRKYVEWVPRADGGGFVGSMTESEAKERFGTIPFGVFKTEDGNDIVETFYFYGIMVGDDGIPEKVVIPFKSTQIKIFKSMITVTTKAVQTSRGLVQPPMWLRRFHLSTVADENKKGKFQSWAWELADGAKNCVVKKGTEEWDDAKAFSMSCREGASRADEASGRNDEDSDGF